MLFIKEKYNPNNQKSQQQEVRLNKSKHINKTEYQANIKSMVQEYSYGKI